MYESNENRGNVESLPRAKDYETARPAEGKNTEFVAPAAMAGHCELFEGGLGI